LIPLNSKPNRRCVPQFGYGEVAGYRDAAETGELARQSVRCGYERRVEHDRAANFLAFADPILL